MSARKPDLTPANADTLRKLKAFVKREGRPPSLSELAGECGVGTTTARYHLLVLAQKGYIKREPGVQQGIEILGKTA